VVYFLKKGKNMNTKDYSEIVVIVDRSGSMQPIREDAIGGFNTFLEEQKKVPGSANLTLVLFNDGYQLVHSAVPLGDAKSLDATTYIPGGTTALLDAIGKTIDDVGTRLAAMAESDRPNKVIVAILTDGLENASRKYTRDRIFDMIKLQTETYKWEFFFLAANQDAIATATSMGMAAGAATAYAPTSDGIGGAYKGMSSSVTYARTGK